MANPETLLSFCKEHFYYKRGNLYWKKPAANRVKQFDKVGTLKRDGTIAIGINGKVYPAHRLIFLMKKGFLPNQVYHLDENKSNNRINNLSCERPYKGISYRTKTEQFIVFSKHTKKYIGQFATLTDAYNARENEVIEK